MNKKQKYGFTLIELMIVVAIIGILASLAIPDFIKFSARARQAEAKANLGGLYVCEVSYFGEYSTYAGGVDAITRIGFSATGEQETYYNYIIDTSILPADLRHPVISLPTGIVPTGNGFSIIAAGNIDRDPFVDVWGMNDAKTLKNMVPEDTGWTSDGTYGNDISH